MTKQSIKLEFGRRVSVMMREKGWNQSDLARQAGLPRDSVSVYIRGKSLPTLPSLRKLASALGVESDDLLPKRVESTSDEDGFAIEMKVSPRRPGEAWLRIDRLVSLSTAAKVIELINSDVLPQRS